MLPAPTASGDGETAFGCREVREALGKLLEEAKNEAAAEREVAAKSAIKAKVEYELAARARREKQDLDEAARVAALVAELAAERRRVATPSVDDGDEVLLVLQVLHATLQRLALQATLALQSTLALHVLLALQSTHTLQVLHATLLQQRLLALQPALQATLSLQRLQAALLVLLAPALQRLQTTFQELLALQSLRWQQKLQMLRR